MGTHRFEDMPSVMDAYSRKAIQGVNRIVRKAATAIDEHVVKETPVATGLARSNWVASLNKPTFDVIPPYVPLPEPPVPEPARKAEIANAGAAMAQANATIRAFDSAVYAAIFICNNVPYIGRLNEGYSGQTPELFVDAAVQSGRIAIRNMKILEGF